MRICKCAVLFLFLSVSVHAYSYAYKVTEVYIKRNVSVSSGTILLGEIARIEGEDTNLRERINRVEIGRSPLPGRKRDISKDTIMCRLRQDNVDLSKISIQSSDTITVLRRCQRITKQEIKRIARSFITNNLTFVPEVVKINSVIARHEVILPTGEIKYSVIVPEYGSLVGKVHFTIVFEVDGTVEGSVLVNADVEVLTQVVVAARRLKRYHVVLEDDVKLENRRVRNIHAITNLDEVIGKRTKFFGKEGVLYIGINDCTLTGDYYNTGQFEVFIIVERPK